MPKMIDAEGMAGYMAAVREVERCEESGPYAKYRKSPGFRPLSFTMMEPPCGCTIEGDGNLKSPIRIKFCDMHARAS